MTANWPTPLARMSPTAPLGASVTMLSPTVKGVTPSSCVAAWPSAARSSGVRPACA